MESRWAEQRRQMVEVQLRQRGIHDERVLDAMASIPREEFVAAQDRASSYSDCPLDIGFHQTISQPFMTALMVQCLELVGTETVLDVGTGSGYHAAVLGRLASRVISIEVVPELVSAAQANLDRTGLGTNVTVVQGDGSLGFPPEAPYQSISVAAGAPQVPPSLLQQLDDPGKMVIPVGPHEDQNLQIITRQGGRLFYKSASQCRFVPLVGSEGWRQ